MKIMGLLLVFILPVSSYAVELSEVALFSRCFSHMTRKVPKLNNPLLKQVVQEKKTGQQACKELLESTRLNTSGVLKNKNNKVAQDILNTFYAFHSQWFMDNDPNGEGARFNEGIVDPSPGSLYLSRAFFDPKMDYKDIFDGKSAHEAIRTGGRPNKNIKGKTLDYYIVGRESNKTDIPWNTLVFPETGDLIGFRDEKHIISPGYQNRTNRPIDFNGSWGGGILGNRDYLMRTISDRNLRANGAIQMPRRFGRAIFHDFLCQELPVVDPNLDTGKYVVPNSKTPFRTNKACVACHVSMDQVSAIARDYTTTFVGRKGKNNRVQVLIQYPRKASIKSKFTWPADGDNDYYKKTHNGKFAYRTTDGEFMEKNISGYNALGNIFKQLDDTYKCAATRYFKYFTGIKYPITKINEGLKNNDPHALLIEQMAQTLEDTQDPMKSIEDLLASDIYKDANYKSEVGD